FTSSPHNQQNVSSRNTLALRLFRRVLLLRLGFVIVFNPSTFMLLCVSVCTSLCIVCERVSVSVSVGVMVEGGVLSVPCPQCCTLPPLLCPTPTVVAHPRAGVVPSPCCWWVPLGVLVCPLCACPLGVRMS